jgi:hypothetical protein
VFAMFRCIGHYFLNCGLHIEDAIRCLPSISERRSPWNVRRANKKRTGGRRRTASAQTDPRPSPGRAGIRPRASTRSGIGRGPASHCRPYPLKEGV